MLELVDLHVYRGATHVLRGISMTVDEGEVVALIGANGAGKTTTLQTVSGLLRPRTGEVTLRSQGRRIALAAQAPEAIVRLGVVHCPEGRQVFASLSVEENLMIGAYARRQRTGIAADLARVHDLFPILAERRAQRAGSLSGGEQMMLAVGRALMARPRLLLLDEPSLGLAPQMVETIFAVIRDLNRAGVTILLVEQNAAMALELAHRGYVLENGTIALSGPAEALLADEQVKHAYLGIAG
ncbi:MAG: ABC transporter ATP-binding protein [Alphaproteobacteria bacterium]|nr:MAG: ABC transporter ATP-binding protein [Alphaproteobacteria bacterium]